MDVQEELIKKIIYVFLACWVFVAACRLYPVAASGGYSLIVVGQLLAAVTFLVQHGLSAFGLQYLEHGLSSCIACA